jgi:putative redox protein
MTMRLHARHKQYPLAHVEVAVSYRHAVGGGRGSFDRAIVMQGDLDEFQRSELLRGAISCPVAKTLEAGADIDTRLADQALSRTADPLADYFEDLFSIVNIDPD